MQTKQKYYFDWLNEVGKILFPNNCCGCYSPLNNQEDTICISCLAKLPRTNYHRLKSNPVFKKFTGRLPVVQATSFLYFKKGNLAQVLLHKLKYDKRKDIGERLGGLFAKDLLKDGFVLPDVILPLPLHSEKEKLRGFNQSLCIANGLEKWMEVPVGAKVVERTVANPTQTKKSRYDRWKNVEEIFAVSEPAAILGKHVMVVDDVITTGSTLESCGRKLLESGARAVSIATLASA